MDTSTLQTYKLQSLSTVPISLEALQSSNDYAASLVKLCSIFDIIAKTDKKNKLTDRCVLTTAYQSSVSMGLNLDPSGRCQTSRFSFFVQPNAHVPVRNGMPCSLIEVAFDIARNVTGIASNATKFQY